MEDEELLITPPTEGYAAPKDAFVVVIQVPA
jgi:hypothetical protein